MSARFSDPSLFKEWRSLNIPEPREEETILDMDRVWAKLTVQEKRLRFCVTPWSMGKTLVGYMRVAEWTALYPDVEEARDWMCVDRIRFLWEKHHWERTSCSVFNLLYRNNPFFQSHTLTVTLGDADVDPLRGLWVDGYIVPVAEALELSRAEIVKTWHPDADAKKLNMCLDLVHDVRTLRWLSDHFVGDDKEEGYVRVATVHRALMRCAFHPSSFHQFKAWLGGATITEATWPRIHFLSAMPLFSLQESKFGSETIVTDAQKVKCILWTSAYIAASRGVYTQETLNDMVEYILPLHDTPLDVLNDNLKKWLWSCVQNSVLLNRIRRINWMQPFCMVVEEKEKEGEEDHEACAAFQSVMIRLSMEGRPMMNQIHLREAPWHALLRLFLRTGATWGGNAELFIWKLQNVMIDELDDDDGSIPVQERAWLLIRYARRGPQPKWIECCTSLCCDTPLYLACVWELELIDEETPDSEPVEEEEPEAFGTYRDTWARFQRRVAQHLMDHELNRTLDVREKQWTDVRQGVKWVSKMSSHQDYSMERHSSEWKEKDPWFRLAKSYHPGMNRMFDYTTASDHSVALCKSGIHFARPEGDIHRWMHKGVQQVLCWARAPFEAEMDSDYMFKTAASDVELVPVGEGAYVGLTYDNEIFVAFVSNDGGKIRSDRHVGTILARPFHAEQYEGEWCYSTTIKCSFMVQHKVALDLYDDQGLIDDYHMKRGYLVTFDESDCAPYRLGALLGCCLDADQPLFNLRESCQAFWALDERTTAAHRASSFEEEEEEEEEENEFMSGAGDV